MGERSDDINLTKLLDQLTEETDAYSNALRSKASEWKLEEHKFRLNEIFLQIEKIQSSEKPERNKSATNSQA